MLLRPLVVLINRQPLEASVAEVEWTYELRIHCKEAEEAHIRALMLQGLLGDSLRLQKLESENSDRPGEVRVAAVLLSTERNDLIVEKVLGRLSLEPSVTAASWDIS